MALRLTGIAPRLLLALSLALAPLAVAGAAVGHAAQPSAPSEEAAYLVGRWTDNPERCLAPVDLHADGSFSMPDGAGGSWELRNGKELTFSGEGGVIRLRIERIGPHELRVLNADGSIGGSYRCSPYATETDAPLSR